MSPSMLLWLVGVVAIGVVLLIWGLRGKRINDHPVCRQCRFDLSGQPEGTITCPECGAGLKRDGSIRTGQRRKRPIAIGLGSLAIVLPMLAVGTLVFALVTGQDLNSYKPIGMLAWEARRADATRTKIVAAELRRRLTTKGVSKQTYDRIVQMALDHQGDVNRAWSPEWGDIIEQAVADAKITKEDRSRYRRQAAVVKFEARPRVRAGEDIPVVAKVVEKRIGGSATLMALAQLKDATVDGAKAKLMGIADPGRGRVSEVGAQSTWFYLYGTSNAWGRADMPGGRLVTLLRLPPGSTPGRKVVNMSLGTMTIEQPNAAGMSWPSAIKKDDPDTRFHEASIAIDVIAADAPGVEVVTPAPDDVKKMELLLEPTGCSMYGGGQVTMTFNVENRPMDFAFDVVLKNAQKEWRVGPLTSGTHGGSMQYYFNGGDKQRPVYGTVSGFRGGKVDVVLRPSEKAALQTTDVTRIYGQEIVFKDVIFQSQGGGNQIQGGSLIGEFVRGLFGG